MAATATPEYELVLMLDPEAPDERRDQIVSEARSRIESAGTLKHDTAWGMRKLAYEIRQRTEADYRFFRFESDPPLLESLDHELKIADGVLRFRIFKVDPRSPLVVPPAPTPGSGPPSRPRRGPEPTPAEGEEPAAEAEPATEAEAPSAPEAAPAETPEADAQPAAAAEEPSPAPEAAPAPERPATESDEQA